MRFVSVSLATSVAEGMCFRIECLLRRSRSVVYGEVVAQMSFWATGMVHHSIWCSWNSYLCTVSRRLQQSPRPDSLVPCLPSSIPYISTTAYANPGSWIELGRIFTVMDALIVRALSPKSSGWSSSMSAWFFYRRPLLAPLKPSF